MSAPKKPAGTTAKPVRTVPVLSGPIELTAEEKRLVAAYRTTDDRGRVFALGVAEGQAERWPRHASPKLRLITGGAV